MEPIIIDNTIVEKHNLSQYCLNTLQNISDRDYPHQYRFDEQISCLDMDSYEKRMFSGIFSHSSRVWVSLLM